MYQPFNDSKHGRDQDDDAAGSEFGPNEIAGTGDTDGSEAPA